MLSKIKTSILAQSESISGFLIIISFALAIIVANIESLADNYISFIFNKIDFGYGSFIYKTSLIHIVNDGLMTFFFLLIGLELKFHLVCGEYRDKKTLILPTAAAIGGIVIPAGFYLAFNYGTENARGWAVPIATDTAFMLGILSFFSKIVSQKLRAFIISFSIIDDALALMILAIFYTSSANILAFFISIILFGLLILINYLNVRNALIYLFIGIFLWVAMVESGIHGTLCGPILALAIPVQINDEPNPSFNNLEHILRPFVYFIILPIFVFINSGISFDNLSLEIITSNISLGIILGLFCGKQLGVYFFSYAAVKMKLCELPYNVSWLKFYAIAILGGIGFTLSLFIGDLTFEDTGPNYAMRVGVIIGSVLSALSGIMILIYLIFKHKEEENEV